MEKWIYMLPKRTIHFKDVAPLDRYRILSSLVVPRPIAWISTVSKEGVTNVAPYSFFNVFGSKPPLVIVNQGDRPEGGLKDTPANIEATGEFVINIVHTEIAQAMSDSSAPVPPEHSEIELNALKTNEASTVAAPLIADSQVNLECKLIEFRTYGENRIVVGEVTCIHIQEDMMDFSEYLPKPDYQPIGKLHGAAYTMTDNRFEITRPVA